MASYIITIPLKPPSLTCIEVEESKLALGETYTSRFIPLQSDARAHADSPFLFSRPLLFHPSFPIIFSRGDLNTAAAITKERLEKCQREGRGESSNFSQTFPPSVGIDAD